MLFTAYASLPTGGGRADQIAQTDILLYDKSPQPMYACSLKYHEADSRNSFMSVTGLCQHQSACVTSEHAATLCSVQCSAKIALFKFCLEYTNAELTQVWSGE